MPSLHLARVVEMFSGYRSTLDKKRREVFDYLIFELAGRREETLVNHPNHVDAVVMNILIEMEQRLREVERNSRENNK